MTEPTEEVVGCCPLIIILKCGAESASSANVQVQHTHGPSFSVSGR
jgi:hypothetical protein